jgi:hypothetical protein
MRILGPIVLTQAPLMMAGQPEMPEGSAVRAQLVSCDLFRREALLAEQLAHEPDSCPFVSSALNQDLEGLTLMINRAPQVHMPAGDPDDHFVEIPAITWSWTAPSQSPGDRRSEFEHPAANALVGNIEPALGKQLLNIAIAQAEPEVQPYSQTACWMTSGGKRCRG